MTVAASASLSQLPLAADATGPTLAAQLRRVERRKQLRAIALTLPLLIFLAVTFLVPLGALLVRAVENPEVAGTLSRTGDALAGWDREAAPPDAAYAALLADLAAIPETAQAGVLARRLSWRNPTIRNQITLSSVCIFTTNKSATSPPL